MAGAGEALYVHQPVMVAEVLSGLSLKPSGIYVDCTVGGGGHSYAILERLEGRATLIGIDRDPEAIAAARERLAPFGDRVVLVRGEFAHLPEILGRLGFRAVDGILYDLGASAHQLMTPQRGFSYHEDGPLDMRMDPDQELTAAKLVNTLSEHELAALIRQYGEEKWATRIARYITERRRRRPITRTLELAEIVKRAIPAAARRRGPHPARRTFMALRVAVNRELDFLEKSLRDAAEILRPGGRLCVLAYHSLEDRIVKNVFRALAGICTCPPRTPRCVCRPRAVLKVVTPHPVRPTAAEVEANPAARSARLRVAERCAIQMY